MYSRIAVTINIWLISLELGQIILRVVTAAFIENLIHGLIVRFVDLIFFDESYFKALFDLVQVFEEGIDLLIEIFVFFGREEQDEMFEYLFA